MPFLIFGAILLLLHLVGWLTPVIVLTVITLAIASAYMAFAFALFYLLDKINSDGE